MFFHGFAYLSIHNIIVSGGSGTIVTRTVIYLLLDLESFTILGSKGLNGCLKGTPAAQQLEA